MDTAPKPKNFPSGVSSTAPKPEASSNELHFIGPAQTKYKTFSDQCIQSIDMYCPDWKNYANPSSYIIPLLFSYRHADVSDESFDKVQKRETDLRNTLGAANVTKDRFLTDRTSDMAEHIVFSALQQLIEDKVRPPFVVVHNLDILKNQTLIQQLFPIVNEEPFRYAFKNCKREYDFLIIGPAIGIIVIEVKSSNYTMGTDFKNKTSKSLPERYSHGLEQLASTESLFLILRACAGIESSNNVPMRKILFTRNLERERYDTWKKSIGDEARRKIESDIGDVIQWFADDLDNSAANSDKPPLYSKLQDLLQASAVGLLPEIFEKYAVLSCGLRSMVYLGGNLLLNTVHLSQDESCSLVHRCVSEQNPSGGQQNPKDKKKKATKEVKLNHSLLNRVNLMQPKLFCLSPDQQAVLEGPPKQFLIGIAGTGKTVILQAKALELLRKGEQVVVFSPESYKQEYEKFFKSCVLLKNQRHYQCFSWPDKGFFELHKYFGTYLENEVSDGTETMEEVMRQLHKYLCMPHENYAPDGTHTIEDVMRHVCEYVKEEAVCNRMKWLIDKNIIIDDTFDEQEFVSGNSYVHHITSLCVALSLMAFVCSACPGKTTWIAFDPTMLEYPMTGNSCLRAKTFLATLNGLLRNDLKLVVTEPVRVTKLKRVMRCSESVFRAAYDGKLPWRQGVEPILSHKVPGLKVENENEFLPSTTRADAVSRLWVKIQETLRSLSRDVNMADVAVILGEQLIPLLNDARSSIMIGNASIPVHKYRGVSSLEWPIVVFASCVAHDPQNWDVKYLYTIAYPRYRAMARATSRLIEITVTYDPPPYSPKSPPRRIPPNWQWTMPWTMAPRKWNGYRF